MARSKVDTCLFCNEAPCACGKASEKKPRAARAPGPKAKDPWTDTEEPKPQKKPVKPKPDFAGAMKAAAKVKRHTPAPPPEPIARKEQKSVVENHDPAFKAALQALAPILHPTLRRKYAEIIDTPLTVEERRIAWKERREYERSGLEIQGPTEAEERRAAS